MKTNITKNTEAALETAKLLSEAAHEPRWALDIRRAGAIAARTLPLPQANDEEWRFTSPRTFFPTGQLEDTQILGETVSFKSLDSSETAEAVAMPTLQALAEKPELEKLFFKADHHQKEIFSALNAAFCSGGAYVELPAKQSCRPITAEHHLEVPAGVVDGSRTAFLHSVIVAQPNSRGIVVESFTAGNADVDNTVCPVIEITAAAGSHLEYVLVYDWDDTSNSLTRLHARVAQDASLKIIFLGLGGQTSKLFLTGDVNAPGANAEVYGLIFADQSRHFDIDTFVHHFVPNGSSNVLINCALTDKARTVFAGNIFVEEQAQRTDAYQRNKNLLLSADAKAQSMPKLEIIADDVRCTHGASFTTYDSDQQFYLQSRGLNDADAKRLIMTGFFQEIIEKISYAPLVAQLSEMMQLRMEASLEK